MGTDIHVMAETAFEYKGETRWSAITEPVFDHMYFNPEQPVAGYNYPYTAEPYSGRNYRLFAFLADVRNGRGFAGIDTGEAVPPISPPRGTPADASAAWRKYEEEWGGDLHAISWFTLSELKSANWDQPIIERGIINEEQYLDLKAGGFSGTPTAWSGSVTGFGIETLTPEQYESGLRGDRETHIAYQWEDTMRNRGDWFLGHTIPGLERNAPRLGDHPGRGVQDTRPADEERIRIVFGFDS